jgi:hypothetical protein
MSTDQYPPIPKGYLRWEPRPKGWTPDKEVKYAFRNKLLPFPQWQEMPGLAIPIGGPCCDYIEAVREPDASEQVEKPLFIEERAARTAITVQEDPRNQRIISLLKKARDHSNRMDMVAYNAIQEAINELTADQ